MTAAERFLSNTLGFDLGGSFGDPFTGKEGSLADYDFEVKDGDIRIFESSAEGERGKEIAPDSDLYKTLKEKFTAEDDFDAGGTTSGIDSLDVSKFTDILGDAVGAGEATPFRPVRGGTAPAMPRMPQGGVSYRPTQSPYQVPSYLMSSAQYNEQISKMLGGLLARSIRSNPIKLLV
jgi:hypothetical protein